MGGPPTPGTIAHKHTHQEKDNSSIRYTNSQDNTHDNTALNNNAHTIATNI